MSVIPYVVENHSSGERAYDIYSRLLQDRIVFVAGEITDQTANSVIAQLLFLEAADPEQEIRMYIHSSGGSISAAFGIHDTMQVVKPAVSTLCIGMAASMGALLLASGAPGRRFALPNSEVMIHQPLGRAEGQVSDIEISARRMIWLRHKLNEKLAELTGQSLQTIESDTDRDRFMSAQEAADYGLIDAIMTSDW